MSVGLQKLKFKFDMKLNQLRYQSILLPVVDINQNDHPPKKSLRHLQKSSIFVAFVWCLGKEPESLKRKMGPKIKH